jgi:cytochrome P450
MTGQTHKYFGDLHSQYGPIVRVGPDQISVISATAWKEVYMRRPELPKDPFSQTPPLNGSDSLFTARGDTHIRLRRTFAPSFTEKALKCQADIIESHVNLLFSRLHRDIEKTADGILDLAKYYGYATLDIISDLTFGESYHSLERDTEHSLVLAFFLGAKFGTVRNSLSTFYPVDRLFGYIFLRLTASARARNWTRTNQKIGRRLEMGNLGITRSDFMSPIIDNIRDGELQGITRNELHTNGLAMVIAGCQYVYIWHSFGASLILLL